MVQAAEIKALRVWAGPDHTRAVFDVSGPLDYRIFSLDNPHRLVLDINGSSLVQGFSTPEAVGLLGGVRTGKQGERDVRVVFDLTEGVRPKSFLLPPADKLGHRLVIDLHPQNARTASVVRTVQQAVPATERNVVIAIDAGHGGEDPGARGASGKTWEKHITLAVARELKRQVDAQPGMEAVLIRDGDYFIPLQQRYQKAREARADLFVSIHADAFHKAAASGSSVFVLSTRGASNEAARWLAASENKSDLVGGVSLEDKDNTLAAVLLDLSQSATLKASDDAANHVLEAMKRLGKTHKPHVERANFVVLRSPDVPSMLVETAFISNPDEEKKLNDPTHRGKLAAAIVEGVRDYFSVQPPPGTWLASNAKPRQRHHVVSRGETLSLIAQRHGVTLASLRSANAIKGDVVKVGDRLTIPLAVGPG
ncbi:N-acetylmuramoyl-L-alanine amidase [Xanthomonadaceae bacterium JHOS43]|nr:N-acetylmuramoyl-L-alanine amidase [Xanthomonadaceae bacterium JHOS43]